MSNKMKAALAAEAVGTFVLAMVALTVSGLTGMVILGLALTVLVALFSGISGAHINPAVTAGMLALRKIDLGRALGYVVAQGVGAIAAWKLFEYFTDTEIAEITTDFSGRMFAGEIIGTATFAMAIAAVMVTRMKDMQAAVTVGFGFMLGIVVATASGTGTLNPALALASRTFGVETFLGPIIGAVVGLSVFVWLHDTSRAE